MRGGTLPPALLAAALGFALAFAPRRVIGWGLGVFAVLAVGAALLPVSKAWEEAIFRGVWASVAVTALVVHLPRGPGVRLALLLAANAGVWAGAVTAVAGTPLDLARALPGALLALPGAWLVTRRGGLAVKVVASWLVAVAILVATLPIVATPGYVSDHLE